jgi:hypothetical protein
VDSVPVPSISMLPGGSGAKTGWSQLKLVVSAVLPLAVPAIVSTAGGGGGSGRRPASSDAPFCIFRCGEGDSKSNRLRFWFIGLFHTGGVRREETGDLAIGVCIGSEGGFVDEEGDPRLSLFMTWSEAFRHGFLCVDSSFTGTATKSPTTPARVVIAT